MPDGFSVLASGVKCVSPAKFVKDSQSCQYRRQREWWGPDLMDDLVPDVAHRASLVADTPRVPRSFYDDPVQLPRVRVGRDGTAFDFIWNRPLGMNADRHARIAGMRLLGRRSTGSRRLA